MHESTVAPTIAFVVFVGSYLGLALGRVPGFRVDRTGVAIIGATLMVVTGVLPWNDAVLSFHETDRPVRTASAAQVRQPMYQGSVDLWKRYGDRLKPLLDKLD